jgi:hypothetical protein
MTAQCERSNEQVGGSTHGLHPSWLTRQVVIIPTYVRTLDELFWHQKRSHVANHRVTRTYGTYAIYRFCTFWVPWSTWPHPGCTCMSCYLHRTVLALQGQVADCLAGCPLFPRSRSVGKDQLPMDSEDGLGFFNNLPVKYYFLESATPYGPTSGSKCKSWPGSYGNVPRVGCSQNKLPLEMEMRGPYFGNANCFEDVSQHKTL